MNPITEAVKAFILKEFLPGQDPDELTESTPLITSRILDSLATIKLVLFIEEQFKISVPDDRVRSMKTFGDMIDAVEAILPAIT